MNVSIIIAAYKPDRKVLSKILKALRNQNFKGKIEIVKIEKEKGFAEQLNEGIRKAKYPVIVSLHQDCIPYGNKWLEKLVEPLKDDKVIATASKVELPKELWNRFDLVSKILSVKEQKVITPALDEKGCAYRKSVLLKIGLFNSKDFRTAGEDYDMYLKLKKLGSIEYPNIKLIHFHYYNWEKRLKKELQLSNGFGALVRIYGRKMPNWYLGVLKSIPLLGYPLFLVGINIKKLKFLSLLALPLYLLVNFIYSYGFWKGFVDKKQTI